MMLSNWLDAVIDGKIATGDPAQIAQAVAASPRFLQAVADGLAQKTDAVVGGPSPAQRIRQELIKAMQNQ